MEKIVERITKLNTSNISDAMDRLGIECCALGIRPLRFGQKICGRAYTVCYIPCDDHKGTVGDFLDDVAPGQVVVIDNGGRENCTVWGDIMARTAHDRGIAGTVIDGVCRDVTTVLECGYPIFSKGYYMRTGKDRVCVAAINTTVKISGIEVNPGDIIFGDDNGVVVIPNSIASQVVDIAEMIEEKEQQIVDMVMNGYSLREARQLTGYHHLQSHKE